MPNEPRDYGIERNFGSGSRDRKNPIGDPHGIPEQARWDHLDLARSGFSLLCPQENGLVLVIQEINLLLTKLVRSR